MTGSDVVETTRALASVLRAARAETETERRPALPLMEALREAQLFRLAVSREDGGLEAAPLDALRVFEELASHEAAVAWLIWNNTLPALMSRYLAPQVRAELFGSPRCVMANSTRPTGRAQPEQDGFRISGRWALVSGCELADCMLLRAVVVPAGGAAVPAAPELIMAYVPKHVCRIVDTWHAGGLRGTGSHDVIVEDVWVRASHCVSFAEAPQLSVGLYAMPFAATLSAGCASVCLGIASGALRTVMELAQTKLVTDRAVALRDQPGCLLRVARMQAQLRAARLLLHDAVGDAWRATQAGTAVGLESRAQIWQAAHHAAAASKDIVRTAYEVAGASALYVDCPIERAHRDLHAATQHVILQEFWLEDAGRVQLGAAPVSPMFAS